jgi:hypothetical protein
MAIVCTFETLLFLWLIYADAGTTKFLMQTPVIFIFFFVYGLGLNAFGYIGALLWRHPAGVIAGIFIPVVISLLAAGPDFIQDYFRSFSRHILQLTGTQPVTVLLAPEHRIAYSGTSVVRQGFTSVAGTDALAILWMTIGLGVITAFIWIALWLVLRHKLRRG